MPSTKLFEPIQVGNTQLSHRVVLAPLTRFRAQDNHVHSDMAVDYYAKRAQRSGSLLISEATFIAPAAVGYTNAPGIWSTEQIAQWRKITDAVHAQGSRMVLQLWATGRTADAQVLAKEGPYDVVSASDVAMDASATVPHPAVPRALTTQEIEHYVDLYVQAAKNAIDSAGFDLVEVHGANGYLIDQFLHSSSNRRSDAYSGATVEGRIKFAVDVIEALVKAVGASRVAIRLSPYNTFQNMSMSAQDTQDTFGALVRRLPKIAYVHLVEPRVAGSVAKESNTDSIDWLVEEVEKKGTGVILAGGFSRSLALERAAQADDVLIAFGRDFIANPDLVDKLEKDLPLKPYNRPTFYAPQGPAGREGYLDL